MKITAIFVLILVSSIVSAQTGSGLVGYIGHGKFLDTTETQMTPARIAPLPNARLTGRLRILNINLASRKPKAHFNGQNWRCPAGYVVYASEREMNFSHGKHFVHCIK